MEVFLLWLDNLDDLVGSVRLLWPAMLSFAIALALFVATILVVMQWPWLLAVVGIVGFGAMAGRALQSAVTARLNTDP